MKEKRQLLNLIKKKADGNLGSKMLHIEPKKVPELKDLIISQKLIEKKKKKKRENLNINKSPGPHSLHPGLLKN